MRLKFNERLNSLMTNKVDLGEIVYTKEKINDSRIETNLHDVYKSPSIYKQNAFYDIECDCKAVHGYGLHVTSYAEVSCNYNYYKLFEKDVCYILYTKGMLCLYDERKALIGVIAKVINC